MVDEGRPIDAPRIVGAEYHADPLPHEFTLEKYPVTPCGLHGGCYAGGGYRWQCPCGSSPMRRKRAYAFQCGNTRFFSKDGRFERFADLVAVLVRPVADLEAALHHAMRPLVK